MMLSNNAPRKITINHKGKAYELPLGNGKSPGRAVEVPGDIADNKWLAGLIDAGEVVEVSAAKPKRSKPDDPNKG